ncbi:MAG TPA: FtsW/RodA/SpoVE family cell cycle protein [Solirubrobacteraceae bacterium]|nr:FtsW/RodA/SpoVE family cell cycle protein [Solirubrobacteraceae bacterium]
MAVAPLQLSDQKARGRTRAPIIFDPLLLLAALGLAGMSVVVFHDLRAAFPGEMTKQALYAGIGLVGAVILTRFDYSRLREYRYGFYILLVLLNLIVYAMPARGGVGQVSGAHRWIPFPFFQLQSSEFGKLLLILALSAVMVERSRKPQAAHRTTVRILLMAILPALIVIGQPDLGTGLVYVVIGLTVLFFGGTSWKHMSVIGAVAVVGAVLALAVAPAVGVNVLKGYQKQRLTEFVNPPKVCGPNNSTCYQLQQSEIAIGAGQKTGQGQRGASQITGGFVPVANEDFIFASLSDIYGFAGAALVLALYAVMIWRAIRIMTMAKNMFGTLIAGGILGMFMFQVFVNVGMTIGIMPVTGVPLPLMSYGGSSVVVTFLAVGLLQSVYIQAKLAAGAKARVLLV